MERFYPFFPEIYLFVSSFLAYSLLFSYLGVFVRFELTVDAGRYGSFLGSNGVYIYLGYLAVSFTGCLIYFAGYLMSLAGFSATFLGSIFRLSSPNKLEYLFKLELRVLL